MVLERTVDASARDNIRNRDSANFVSFRRGLISIRRLNSLRKYVRQDTYYYIIIEQKNDRKKMEMTDPIPIRTPPCA